MKKILKGKILLLFFMAVVFAAFNAGYFSVLAEDASDYREEIKDVTKDLEKEKAKESSLKSNLNVTQSEINITAGIINKTEQEISRKEAEIKNLNQRIELNKRILGGYIQQMSFENYDDPVVKFAFSGTSLNKFSGDFDSMVTIKEKVLAITREIKDDKQELEGVKEELAEKKEEHQDLLENKYVEKDQIVGEIVETQATIEELQAKLSKLRSILSKFLGESYTMDDVIDAVKYADKKTGVRKEFLFAMLDKETDLGRFTGGCNYKESKMGDKNLSYFKDICDDLGYNYKKMKVSCPLSYGIGGAMGVAQFMPSTWVGWSSKISNVTGNDPADPWRLEDGIIGMALKLKAAGADSKSKEHYAAKVYYCGGPSSKYWKTHCEAYADTVVSWAKGYDDYF